MYANAKKKKRIPIVRETTNSSCIPFEINIVKVMILYLFLHKIEAILKTAATLKNIMPEMNSLGQTSLQYIGLSLPLNDTDEPFPAGET